MLARFLSNTLNYCYFATVIGGKVNAEMPQVQFPTKPKPRVQQQFPMTDAYQTINYVRKDKLPNCRYFAFEYKNRIYHFYNAYYYPLGRMINRVASEIRGRTSPHYQNQIAKVQHGDICVIVNIEDPLVTGKKLLFKKLRYHTGFIGHLKEYSYKHVLNHKPELLYHHLLRKVMPKNKLSSKYLDNLVLCRGPTHNLKQFPQFAPDKKVYSKLSQIDLLEMLKNSDSIQVVEESTPGAAKEILQREPERYVSERDRIQMERERDEVVEDLTRLHEDMPKYKMVPNISRKEYEVLKRKQKRIEERYRPIRAPYKKSQNNGKDTVKMYKSERKARKDPNYQLLKNEDLEQIEDEDVAPNPHVVGGAVEEDAKKDK